MLFCYFEEIIVSVFTIYSIMGILELQKAGGFQDAKQEENRDSLYRMWYYYSLIVTLRRSGGMEIDCRDRCWSTIDHRWFAVNLKRGLVYTSKNASSGQHTSFVDFTSSIDIRKRLSFDRKRILIIFVSCHPQQVC